MNIIEAIKSGKPFRRRCWDNEYWLYQDYDHVRMNISRADVKADDWEVQEISCYAGSVTITTDQFYAAWRRAVSKSFHVPEDSVQTMADLVATELGL